MDSSRKLWLLPVLRQSGMTSSIIFNDFGQGMVSGITSGMIANMLTADADFRINMGIASWLGPMLGIGSILMLTIGSFLINKIDRKITYILTNIPVVIGVVMNACAYNVTSLLFGRFLCGVSRGSMTILVPMIFRDFLSPQYRRTFFILRTSSSYLGILLVHFLTYYMHWRKVTFIVAAVFVISIMIAFVWPKSPYWLAENEKLQKSEEVFYWLRGKNRDSVKEFDEVVKNQQNTNNKKTFSEDIGEFFMKFKKKKLWKPFVIVTLALIMKECSCSHVFPAYTILIIKDMTFNSVYSFYYDIALISIITISVFISAYLVNVFKLRPFLFTTGFVGVTDLYLTSLSKYLVSNGTLSQEYSWISIYLLGLFFIIVNLCCTLAPQTLAGEILPSEHKAVNTVVLGYLNSLIVIFALKITPFLMKNFKGHGTFTFFASGLLLSLVGLYILLPETTNKTLQEVGGSFTYDQNGDRRMRVPQNDEDDEENKNETNIVLSKSRLENRFNHSCNSSDV